MQVSLTFFSEKRQGTFIRTEAFIRIIMVNKSSKAVSLLLHAGITLIQGSAIPFGLLCLVEE